MKYIYNLIYISIVVTSNKIKIYFKIILRIKKNAK